MGVFMKSILKVDSLKKFYGKEPNLTKALNDVSFQILEGEFVGIMGSSGSGKTTLLNCIATIIKPTSGSIKVNEEELTEFNPERLSQYRGMDMGYIFQNFELLDNLNAKENILLPLSLHNISLKESIERLDLLSDYLDISKILNRFPQELSGGEK